MSLRTVPEMLNVRALYLKHVTGYKLWLDLYWYTYKYLPSLVFDKKDGPLTSEEEEQRAIAKIKMLGNIKFIGELGKLGLIHESILHRCIKTVSVNL